MAGRRLTSRDPEPPLGTVVENDEGVQWERVQQPLGGTYWCIVGDEAADPESWIKIAGNYGPVKVTGR